MRTIARGARVERKIALKTKARAVQPQALPEKLEDLLRQRDAMDFVRIVKSGIPAKLVDAAVARFGITKERFVILLHTSKPTVNRLISEDRVLDPLVSGAFKEAAQVLEKVREAFGGDQTAMTEWLNAFVPALGTRPIELLDTPDGRDLVAATIDRARYGIVG